MGCRNQGNWRARSVKGSRKEREESCKPGGIPSLSAKTHGRLLCHFSWLASACSFLKSHFLLIFASGFQCSVYFPVLRIAVQLSPLLSPSRTCHRRTLLFRPEEIIKVFSGIKSTPPPQVKKNVPFLALKSGCEQLLFQITSVFLITTSELYETQKRKGFCTRINPVYWFLAT